MSRILLLTSQSMVCRASNCGGEEQDYVKTSLVKSKITREFCIQKVAPQGSLDDAASAISKKVSNQIGISIRYFWETYLCYQKISAMRVIG